MRKIRLQICVFLLAVVVMSLAVWGPEALANYQDRNILNQITRQEAGGESEGYRYSMSANDKLFILSKCLNSQTLPGDQWPVLTAPGKEDMGYQELTGSYAFVVNHRDPSDQEITDDELYETCNREIQELIEAGVLPDTVKEMEAGSYEAVRYLAVYVPEPRNNVSVWKLTLSTGIRNADRQNRLLDVYLDADTGKIYEFYVRTPLNWEEIDADAMVQSWARYMGLGEPTEYGQVNPLQETTPLFRKYSFEGMEGDSTVVTIGFYEGIKELFLKISR